MRKRQGRRPLLDACGLRALRWHCITHRHDYVIGITKWAQEYFQKPLSVNTIHRAICRCHLKLYHAKRKPYGNMVQKRRRVLWAKAHLKWTVSKKSVLWSDESKLGPNSNTKTPESHNLHAQMSSNCFEKKRRCYTMLNMPQSQLFWNEFEMSSFCEYNFKISQFKHLLCSIVNKILIQVIRKSFSFNCIQV